MAVHHTFETDESVVPEAMRRFLWRRAYEISALAITSIVVVLGLALASWSADDPSLNHSIASKVTNWLGAPGAVVADLLMQSLGLACTIFVLVPLSWAAQLFQHKNIQNWKMRILFWLLASLAAAIFLASMPIPATWGLARGVGGFLGEIAAGALLSLFSIAVKSSMSNAIVFSVATLPSPWVVLIALGRGLMAWGGCA